MMRRTFLVTAAIGVMLAGGACQSDGADGLSHVYGPPMFDMHLGPASDAAFPTVVNTRITPAAAHDTIEFAVNNLPPLGFGNFYLISLVDSASGNAIAATSRIIRRVRTWHVASGGSATVTTATDTATTAQFAVTDTATSVAIRIVNASIPNYTHVVLRSGGEGNLPFLLGPSVRTGFLSFQYRSGTSFAAQNATFGSWAATASARVPFVATAAVDAAGFWGDWVRIDLTGLTRPPAGFRYAVWLEDVRTRTATRLGGLITPLPDSRSLDDADLTEGPWYTGSGIPGARVRLNLRSIGVLPQHYTSLAIVIEPYGGYETPTQPGRGIVLSAAIPPAVANQSAEPGK